MSLISEGSLAHRPLAEIYWEIFWKRSTGRLMLRHGAHRKEVDFMEGLPCRASSTVQSEALARFLLDRRLVDPQSLDRATLLTVSDKLSLPEGLEKADVLQGKALDEALRLHAREIFLVAFRSRQASYSFERPEAVAQVAIRPADLDFFGLLREGVSRYLDFESVAGTLEPWSTMTIVRTASSLAVIRTVRLTTEERRVFHAIDGMRRIADLIAHLRIDPSRLFPILYLFRCVGLLRGSGEPEHLRGPRPSVPASPTPPPGPAARGVALPAAPPSPMTSPVAVRASEPARRPSGAMTPIGLPPESSIRERVASLTPTVMTRTPSGEASPSHVVSVDEDAASSSVIAALAFDGYQVLRTLGRGGWGWVYQAYQEKLDRMVAVKVLSPRLPRDSKFLERFFREAKSAARLSHGNIVTVFDASEQQGHKYLVMEYVEGVTLRDLVETAGPLSPPEAVWAITCVALALEHAHARAVLHRDVKPENVFLSKQGYVKLGDWGLAKSFVGQDASITDTGLAMGTPNYMSPEQLRASREIDHRTDIYSLGALLYYLVSGRPPYEGPSVVDIMASHLLDPPPDPRRGNPLVPDDMAAVIGRCMAKEPAQRYQSAAEVIAALQPLPHG